VRWFSEDRPFFNRTVGPCRRALFALTDEGWLDRFWSMRVPPRPSGAIFIGGNNGLRQRPARVLDDEVIYLFAGMRYKAGAEEHVVPVVPSAQLGEG